MKPVFQLLLVSLLLRAPALLPAEEWIIPRTTYYLTADQQRLDDFPPPPSPGSPEDRRDLKAVLDWQRKRTPGQCSKAAASARADFENFFGDISPFPSPLPEEAAVIFGRVKIETDGIAAGVKEKHKRKRPFLRDPALDPCLGRIGGLSYPSGHATISRVFALMLADLVPARRADYLRRADEAALDRVIGGVHHPADIEAGKRLADRIYGLYRKSKAFSADMKTLRGLLFPAPLEAGFVSR